MATRYSGDMVIKIRYVDASYRTGREHYVVSVRYKEGEGVSGAWRENIYPPYAGFGAGVAYDSRRAYNEVAKVALARATEEEPGLEDYVERTKDTGQFRVRYEPYRKRYRSRRVIQSRASLNDIVRLAQDYRNQIIRSRREGTATLPKDTMEVLHDALFERYPRDMQHFKELADTRGWVLLFDLRGSLSEEQKGRHSPMLSAADPTQIDWNTLRSKASPHSLIIYVPRAQSSLQRDPGYHPIMRAVRDRRKMERGRRG